MDATFIPVRIAVFKQTIDMISDMISNSKIGKSGSKSVKYRVFGNERYKSVCLLHRVEMCSLWQKFAILEYRPLWGLILVARFARKPLF